MFDGASDEMSNDQHQRGCAIVDDRGGFCSTEQSERMLDIGAAASAFAGPEIIFEIGIT